MVKIGLFFDQRLELIDGLIVEMSPRGDRHAFATRVLTELFVDRGCGRYHVNPGKSYSPAWPSGHARARLCFGASESELRARGDEARGCRVVRRDCGSRPWMVRSRSQAENLRRRGNPGVSPNRFASAYLHEQKYDRDAVISPHEFPDVNIPIAHVFGIETGAITQAGSRRRRTPLLE